MGLAGLLLLVLPLLSTRRGNFVAQCQSWTAAAVALVRCFAARTPRPARLTPRDHRMSILGSASSQPPGTASLPPTGPPLCQRPAKL